MPSEYAIEVFTRGLFEPELVTAEMLTSVLVEFGVSYDMYFKLMCQVQSEISSYKNQLHQRVPHQR